MVIKKQFKVIDFVIQNSEILRSVLYFTARLYLMYEI